MPEIRIKSVSRKSKARTSPHHRFVIALCSPGGVVETGLSKCSSAKRATKVASKERGYSFSSPVCGQDSRNCGHFRQLSTEYSQTSLQSRLRGGESGIRTLGTGC